MCGHGRILQVLLSTNFHWPYPNPIKLSRTCIPIPFRVHLLGFSTLLALIDPGETQVGCFWPSCKKFFRRAPFLRSREYWLKYKYYAEKLSRYIKFAARHIWDTLCSDCSNQNKVYKLLHWFDSRDALSGDNVFKSPTPLAAIYDQTKALLHFR